MNTNNIISNPFEFEYNEILDEITTKHNIKFYKEYENLDKTKQYIGVDFSIYKILGGVDYFTWLNEPESEINFRFKLYYELDKELKNLLLEKFIQINKNCNIAINKNLYQIEELNFDDYWLNCWYKKSKYATDKINLLDTYIPTNIEFI